MEELIDRFDSIDECLECSRPIKLVKLKFVESKIENITQEELIGFKYCSKCKRKAIRQK